jgi:hypothetical protein
MFVRLGRRSKRPRIPPDGRQAVSEPRFKEGEFALFIAEGAVGNGKEPESVRIVAVKGRMDGEQLYRVGRIGTGHYDEHDCYESYLSPLTELPSIKLKVQKEKSK